MKVIDVIKSDQTTLSFEFFPPKDEQQESQLFSALAGLKRLNPDFVSVTYGAMGKTKERTFAIVEKIKESYGIEPVAHLTCVADTKEQIREKLIELKQKGMENILALRGDPPLGEEARAFPVGGFRYANELVAFIKKETPGFCVGVAGYPEGHPEAPSVDKDIEHLKGKIDAGAEFIITQLFFDNDFFFRFVEKCQKAGIQIPIISGLMIVTNLKQIKKFTDMCGATIPKTLMAKLEKANDQDAIVKIGTEWALEQCRGLMEQGVPGLHFFVLNRAEPVSSILAQLEF